MSDPSHSDGSDSDLHPAEPVEHDKTSEQTPVGKFVTPEPRMQYLHAYSFIFESPNWAMNLLASSLCFLVNMFLPGIGAIVASGYQWDVAESKHRFPNATYPDFDFNRIIEYLVRGVWSFLVNMLIGFFQTIVYIVAYIGVVFAVIGASNAAPQGSQDTYAAAAATIAIPAGLLVVFGMPVLIRFITMPLVMKASFSQDPKGLVDFGFLRNFVRLTWKEMLLEQIWMSVTAPIVYGLGLLLLIVGILPAMAIWGLADAHTNWQLYEIYLARGGEPIPLKPLKPVPAPGMHPPYEQAAEVYQATGVDHVAPGEMPIVEASRVDETPGELR